MSMTHKEWMRRCIEECKTCGNLNTASGAERLIEKFAERMDETNGQPSEEMGKQVVIEASFQDGQMTYSLKNMTYDELYSRIMADSLLGVCLRMLPPAGLGTNVVSIDWNLRVALENGSNTQTIHIGSSLDDIYILPDGSITTENPNAE